MAKQHFMYSSVYELRSEQGKTSNNTQRYASGYKSKALQTAFSGTTQYLKRKLFHVISEHV